MYVLGIETSCDDTGLAIYNAEKGILSNVLHSQIATHQNYGGVVPELAARDHIKYIVPLLDQALQQADLAKKDLHAIAYTAGPGLIGPLLTGACFAKSLAFALNIPAIAVHHLEAHLLAAQLNFKQLIFPFLALLVSGGHTQLIVAHSLGKYEIIGETLDDAVGEAFDKTAKLMGLSYPGGPLLANLADYALTEELPYIAAFPRPMVEKANLNFSFSGLKTHAMHVWNNSKKDNACKIAIAKAFQLAVVDVFVIKCKRALLQTGYTKLVIAGGVGANKALRRALTRLMQELSGEIYFPQTTYCTDNGAMVAYTGYMYLQNGQYDTKYNIEVKPRWPFPHRV